MRLLLLLLVLIITSGLQADTFFRTYDVEGGTEYFRKAIELPYGGFAGMRVHWGANPEYEGLMFFDANGDSTAYIDEIYADAFCLTDDSCLVFVTEANDWTLLWTDLDGNILDEVLITDILPTGYACDVIQTADGGFFLSGDELAVKVDSSGSYEWDLFVSEPQSVDFRAVTQLEDGAFVAGGQASGPLDYIVKISSDGIIQWEWSSAGIGVFGLQTVAGGFTACSYYSRIRMFSTTGDTLWSYTSEHEDVKYLGIAIAGTDIIACGSSENDSLSVITKLDSSGLLIWEQVYPSCGFHSIGSTADEGFILAGVYPYPYEAEMASLLVKTDSDGWYEGMGIEPDQTVGALNLEVYPNPSSAYTVLNFNLDSSVFVSLEVFDISGRSVIEISGTQYNPGKNEILIEGLGCGLYFCRLTSGDFTASERFVVIE